MRISLRVILPLVIVASTPTFAAAQIGFPGGINESPRPIITEGRPFDAGARFKAKEAAVTWLLGSGGRAGEAASVFSAFGGFSLQGALSLEGVLTYARVTPEELDGVNTVQGAVELGLPISSLERLGIAVALSGEGQWTEEAGQGYAVGAAASLGLGPRVEVGGGVAYSGSIPDAVLIPNSSLRGNYTFENDLDGEASYEAVGTYRLEMGGVPPFQLRLGINNDADVSAGIILFF
jgi:hypothetical protein